MTESFVDTEIRNDFAYYYTVAGVGPSDTCLGPMSSCTAVAAAAGPSLTIAGECPDPIVVTVAGATPDATVVIAGSLSGGSFPLPSPCEGAELDLASPRVLASGTADPDGRFTVEATTAVCGARFQGLDLASCETTPLLGLP